MSERRAALSTLTKSRLLDLARRMDIAGRSSMNKAQLVDALLEEADGRPELALLLGMEPLTQVGGWSQGTDGSRRRTLFAERLAGFVDDSLPCSAWLADGPPCGLPVVRGSDRCVLHGGLGGFDLAVPTLGRLGPDTWPALIRHLRAASYDIDPLGLDPVVAEIAWHLANALYFDYFRVRVEGIEHVPASGPAMLVANHGGAALPYDGAMLQLAVMNEAPTPRRVRVLGTELFNMLPFVSHLYRKTGAAYASREDARWLLERRHLVGVFPEGERGFMKPVWQAYRVERFGRGGFVEIAMRHASPIVPVAILGSEEVHPALFVSKRLAQLVRAVFPQQRVEGVAVFLNPIPLPVRWHIRFLPPVDPATDRPDRLGVLETSEQIRNTIQANLDEMLRGRGSMF